MVIQDLCPLMRLYFGGEGAGYMNLSLIDIHLSYCLINLRFYFSGSLFFLLLKLQVSQFCLSHSGPEIIKNSFTLPVVF